MEVVAYLHGIYPRSEAVVAATRDLGRGRTTVETVDAAFEDDLETLVADQRAAGLDLFSDGLLRWQDVFRPLVDAAEGMRATHLQRWFDNNTFIRTPRLDGDPRLDAAPAAIAGGTVPGPRVATLPSPYLFSRIVATDGDRDALMVGLARAVLRPVADDLAGRGWGLVHLEEPWLGFHGIEPGTWSAFADALGVIADGLEVPVVLHVALGDAARHADRLGELPVDAVGVDAPATELDALPTPWPTGLLVGCLDGRNTPLEPVGPVAEVAAQLAERLAPTRLYLSTNTELELVPREVARRKVARLGEIAAELRGVLA